MIIAKNLSVSLSGKSIVHGVSLTAKPGEITAIVGPNGSGKTTMLKALAGELASKGDISLNGHDVRALEPWQLAVKRAVLPQAATIAFPFTVREIVRLGLTVGPNRHAERIDAVTAEALGAVDLARVLSQIWEPVLDGEPCFLMLDEPVSALDIRHQLTIMQLARHYCEGGGGVIAVMHDLNLTAMFADHMVMMKNGRIERSGPPAAVMTDDAMEAVFGCRMRINGVPAAGVPFVLPHTASA